MSRSKVGSHWKRPATHVYDYNYSIGEHYYKPQLSYADKRFSGRAGSPPKAKTFAERFAEDPVYGQYGPPRWRTSATGSAFQPRRASLSDDLGFGRRLPADDDSFFPRRRPLNDDDFGVRRKPFDEEEFFRRRPPAFEDEDLRFNAGRDEDFGRSRFEFRDKILDAAGARFGGGRDRASPSPFRAGAAGGKSTRFEDFEEDFFNRPKRTVPRSADPDMHTTDPFKLRNAKAFALSDDLDDDMFSRDAETVVGRIRSKLRAKREKEEGGIGGLASSAMDDDFGTSRIDQLRSKQRARMADLDDDFGEMSLKPKTKEEREQLNRISNLSSKYFNDMDSSAGGGSGTKSIHIKKRTVRTVDSD